MKSSRAWLVALASLALALAAPAPRSIVEGGEQQVLADSIGVRAVAHPLRHGQPAPLGIVALAAETYALVPYVVVEPFEPDAAHRPRPISVCPPLRARAPPARG